MVIITSSQAKFETENYQLQSNQLNSFSFIKPTLVFSLQGYIPNDAKIKSLTNTHMWTKYLPIRFKGLYPHFWLLSFSMSA